MTEDNFMSNSRSGSLDGFIDALQIFSKHMKNGLESRFPFNAEHDVFYINVTADELPEDSPDGILLDALGWHLDSDSESWAYFT